MQCNDGFVSNTVTVPGLLHRQFILGSVSTFSIYTSTFNAELWTIDVSVGSSAKHMAGTIFGEKIVRFLLIFRKFLHFEKRVSYRSDCGGYWEVSVYKTLQETFSEVVLVAFVL